MLQGEVRYCYGQSRLSTLVGCAGQNRAPGSTDAPINRRAAAGQRLTQTAAINIKLQSRESYRDE
ncbi:MAG: hypothetical protein ANABAC_1748 [Anaerolineae bacterium]|nr:MAG: hypothetical protein ANABAC_1748 [Anaerolineae bacterium]